MTNLLDEDRGSAVVEYGLGLALIGLIVVVFLKGLGVEQSFFDAVDAEGEDYAADIRKRTMALEAPPVSDIFAHVYNDEHAGIQAEAAWLEEYLASFEEGSS